MSSGALAGFPVVDIKATLYDGSYHDVDSSVLAFQIAARGAFREAMPKAGVRLLEPVMKVPDHEAGFDPHSYLYPGSQIRPRRSTSLKSRPTLTLTLTLTPSLAL